MVRETEIPPALAMSSETVERIIVSPEERDSIWKVSQVKENFFNNYTLVFSGESFRVYDLSQ